MSWNIKEIHGIVIVTMTSNPVNMQNPAFFSDLNETFDVIENDYAHQPVVLTGSGRTFSAGIDFEYSFKLFERGDADEIRNWYADFRDSMLRVMKHPSLTIAALNGHAFAGGLILALACDERIAGPAATRFALNEVLIGIPMPMAYNELIAHRVGVRAATDAILTGREFGRDEAIRLGFLTAECHEEDVVEQAITRARMQNPDTAAAYAHTKTLLQRPLHDRIERLADDNETIGVITSPESVRAQRKALEALKRS